MLKKILPIALFLVGSGAGVGAGIFLREPAAEIEAPAPADNPEVSDHVAVQPHDADNPPPLMEYVKLSNQFVVPIVQDQKVVALVVLALSLEVPEGQKDAIYKKEPKLRDSFLQVLFDHANIGGFGGEFTDVNNLAVLRNALREVAQRDMGKSSVHDVLILEIARQDY
ncbi:MAG: flagellar basal body-associated FliL family protein [Sulfitobacter sp.]